MSSTQYQSKRYSAETNWHSEFTSDMHSSSRARYKGRMKLFPVSYLKFEEHKVEAARIYRFLSNHGIDATVKSSDKPLLEWVKYFQANLRYYAHIPIESRCLEQSDYLYGCLIGGPDFAEWLKKARHYTMQYSIALDSTAIPDEYIVPGYVGYDSFFPESALIHWEEVIDDFPWSLSDLQVKVDRTNEKKYFKELLDKFGPSKLMLKGTKDALRFVKASKFYDPNSGKSHLIRDLYPELPPVGPYWIGKRTPIQAFPGGGRDGTMATPNTLVKIKLSNEIFLQICQGMKNSAMCDYDTQHIRISRVRERCKVFLHWDFKKVGLMTNRTFFLGLADAVQELYDIDMSWFDFEHLFVIDDEEVYQTKRGYALGWMNEAITIVIIRWIREFADHNGLTKLMDFVVFNDDVEMGFFDLLTIEEMELIKASLIEFFKSKDVPCSIRKIFFSYESIFLEDYFYPKSKFDFSKKTIATRLYAKAASCSVPFLRKAYTNAAMANWYCSDIVEEIIKNTSSEFPIDPDDERDLPYESGGWISRIENGLNYSLVDDMKATLISSFMNKLDVTIETAAYDGPINYSKNPQHEERLVNRSRRGNFPTQINKSDIQEFFDFDLGTSLSHLRDMLPPNSKFRSLTFGLPYREAVEDPSGVG